jgi:hypothetical protein
MKVRHPGARAGQCRQGISLLAADKSPVEFANRLHGYVELSVTSPRVDLDVKVHILGIGGDFTRMIRVVGLLVQDHRPHRVSGAGSYPWRPPGDTRLLCGLTVGGGGWLTSRRAVPSRAQSRCAGCLGFEPIRAESGLGCQPPNGLSGVGEWDEEKGTAT